MSTRLVPCLFVKRSLGPGYAGIDNTLFYTDGTMMAGRIQWGGEIAGETY